MDGRSPPGLYCSSEDFGDKSADFTHTDRLEREARTGGAKHDGKGW